MSGRTFPDEESMDGGYAGALTWKFSDKVTASQIHHIRRELEVQCIHLVAVPPEAES